MTTSTYPAMGGAVDNTSAATFIPEIWSDEIRAEYEKSLVVANLVRRMDMVGQKGDTIHLPAPVRGTANAKAENTAVTIQQETEGEVQVVIDKHYEYSRLIEDITAKQAHDSLRQFYTQDAGYQLAKQVDTDLHSLGKSLGDGDGSDYTHSNSFYIDASTGLTAYAADTVVGGTDLIDDDGIRSAIKELDDADVPMDGRVWVVPPSAKKTLLGVDRFVSSDFVSGSPVENGRIGNVYGTEVYVSTNCPVVETAAANSASSTDTLASLMFQQDAFIFCEQLGVRSQTQYKQEFLADLFTADTIYGVKTYRPENGLVICVGA